MRGLRDALWILGVYAVLGVVGALVWWKVADPPYYVRTADDAVMEQAQLGQQVHVDGRFLLIGLVVSLVAGVALAAWRRHGPLTVVLLGALAAAAAGGLALWLGTTLGHQDLREAAKATQVGGHVTDSLRVISRWVVIVWPVGHLAGTLAVLLGAGRAEATERRGDDGPRDDAFAAGGSVGRSGA